MQAIYRLLSITLFTSLLYAQDTNTPPVDLGTNVVEAAPPAATNATAKATAPEAKAAEEEKKTFLQRVNGFLEGVLFIDVTGGAIKHPNPDEVDEKTGERKSVGVPLMVVVLVCGALFFTFFFGFINIRGFKHSISVIRGKYDNPDEEGEISHFQALTSALSATVGLGNIAGVAVAIQKGGPGAVFWMLLAAVFGMTAKFVSCTLAQMYRKRNLNGTISGGPMYYLDIGLKERGLAPLGKLLGFMYAIVIMFAAAGAGNMFQSNQSAVIVTDTLKIGSGTVTGTISDSDLAAKLKDSGTNIEALAAAGVITQADKNWEVDLGKLDKESALRKDLGASYGAIQTHLQTNSGAVKTTKAVVGIIVAVLVGLVIIGGIRRIGSATSKIIPAMCMIYVAASIFVILMHISAVPDALSSIFTMAFTDNALKGGLIGVLIIGLTRAAFSNEAGLGSAAIAHAAAKTKEPIREGIVAMMGPFIDTIVVCLMTALVVVVSGVWTDPAYADNGIPMTAAAFESAIGGFQYILMISVLLFAFSTMIAWCYYGERGWVYIVDHIQDGLGIKSLIIYRIGFIACIFLGAVSTLKDVLGFSDLMALSLAFPNIIGSLFLISKVREKTNDYWSRYKSGEMKTYK